uniref:aminotransferase class I/II-fold pyridoxal phosphate-dependent enzyme n=1 Tax=Agathobacter sp. TaxID=2021311 RepID=UPI00405777F1
MLYQKLTDYAKSNIYPFHMPGHKRQALHGFCPYETDITEIEGFDNLHHAREILYDAQQKAAGVYGSKMCFYLVNGSTCGILAAISATAKRNGKVLVARNSHKSVYHALFLRQLRAEYVYPQETQYGIQGQVTKQQIETILMQDKEISAVIVTSPTYDGVVSDIRQIADTVHKYDIPLIVDSAHGAHFGFSESFPQNAVKLGADIVMESVHKTLPAFTQTALMHICSDRVSIEKVKSYLSIYETSSPSYVLMAGIDMCMEFLAERGMEYFQKYEKRLSDFYEKTKYLKNLKVITKSHFKEREAFDFDKSKIIVLCKNNCLSGVKLQEILLKEYRLQMEMACQNYVLALSSVMDTEEGFGRLAEALIEIDAKWDFFFLSEEKAANVDFECPFYQSEEKTYQNIYKVQKRNLEIFEAQEMEYTEALLEEAVGKTSADYIYLYPPGIPILVPGEEITQEFVADIRFCQRKNLEVQGLSETGKIKIVVFS